MSKNYTESFVDDFYKHLNRADSPLTHSQMMRLNDFDVKGALQDIQHTYERGWADPTDEQFSGVVSAKEVERSIIYYPDATDGYTDSEVSKAFDGVLKKIKILKQEIEKAEILRVAVVLEEQVDSYKDSKFNACVEYIESYALSDRYTEEGYSKLPPKGQKACMIRALIEYFYRTCGCLPKQKNIAMYAVLCGFENADVQDVKDQMKAAKEDLKIGRPELFDRIFHT